MTFQEKRRAERTPLSTSCHCEFVYGGKNHSAIMIDLSDHGARFSMEKSSDHTELRIGDIVVFSIITPYGKASCSGRLIWTQHQEEYYSWGIEFVLVSEDPGDPLRCLIESPF